MVKTKPVWTRREKEDPKGKVVWRMEADPSPPDAIQLP